MERVTSTRTGRGGVRLHDVDWTRKGNTAHVVLVHGLGEHSGRYEHVAERLTRAGYDVHSYDQRGHGCSGGRFGQIDSLEDLVADLESRITGIQDAYPDEPVFVLGHSMGSLVALTALARGDVTVDGAVVTGAAVTAGDDFSPILQNVVRVVGRVAPFVPLQKLDAGSISRDPEVVAAYESDPLVSRSALTARTALQMLEGIEWLQSHLDAIDTPLLIVHGTEDRLTDPAGSRMLHERASSTDTTLRMWDGLYHEVMNEPEQTEVTGEIIDWLDSHR